MKGFRLCIVVFFMTNLISAQKDSTEVNKLQEVLLIGNGQREAINRKLFKVTEINRQDIDNVAGNNLADVLNQNLNITITPDPATGRSTISMFGLDGGYVKILVDNVPLVSDNGYGGDIDISQINLENIERIEIVEGAMGVLYGDNAVAGVINIITKKSSSTDWSITASVQEETVGSEYNFKDEGRHIQNLRLSHNINDKLFASVGYSRNDFKGFFNDYNGKDYFKVQGSTILNDGLRGYEWNPKEQQTLDAILSYSEQRFRIHYKFNYYNEDLDIHNHFINSRVVDGNYVITANDENFQTNRFSHQLQAWGSFRNDMDYMISASYQKQERDYKNYVYNIGDRETQEVTSDYKGQSSDLIFSKGSLSNMFASSSNFNLTTGYEVVYQQGYDATASGDYSSNIAKHTLGNYDIFALADFNLSPRISLHPGLRLNNNTNYDSHLIWSLSANYDPTKSTSLKAVLGSAYKTPTFTNLYFYFVDSNHDVRGNPDLKPEDGISALVSASKNSVFSNGVRLSNSLKAYYFDIEDKIDLAVVGDNAQMQYLNISNYSILGLSAENKLRYNNLQLGLGLSFNGISQNLGTQGQDSGYLFNFNANATANYLIPPIDTRFSAQLKYNGKIDRYVQDPEIQSYVKGEQDAFTWLDISVQKSFFERSFEVSLGARNVLDVVQVNNTALVGQNHDAAQSSLLLGHGRSYFVKVLYNLNF